MSNVKYNKEIIKDKILACWIGKNIGGTMGGPFEWTKEFLDIKGYTTPKGEPLPNDDLDLQLAWLWALERYGVRNFDANTLAETWINMITPNWSEYGLGKKNLKMGLLPPLCGEYENEKWKHSNGAWIRSEIWACLAPGYPNVAIKYAIMDASIDHGLGEGLYGEIFTAAMQSIAFFETDIRKIIETALGFIPKDCRVAQCIRLVIEEYDKKTPYKDVRNMLIESTADLGWFQAPANLGFVAIGLMYGEGDFKKSMIYAINCGDDTDCTGGTVGALLGIVGGTACIPPDWYEYIGDRIIQICVNPHYRRALPTTCTEFTDRILSLQPAILAESGVNVSYGEALEYNQQEAFDVLDGYSAEYFDRSRYSFDVSDFHNFSAIVNFKKEPVIKEFKSAEIKLKLKYLGTTAEVLQCNMQLILPDGWSADYRKNMHVVRREDLYPSEKLAEGLPKQNEYTFTITANENIKAQNKIYMIITEERFPTPFVIPITLLG